MEGHSIQHPGVFGESIQSQGVVGRSETSSGVLGVTFTSTPTSHGVFGSSTKGGNGVVGFVGDATGVVGNSVRGTGVHGITASDTFAGVLGENVSTKVSGVGVSGICKAGTGVFGSSVEGTGVWGHSLGKDGVIGVGRANGVVGSGKDGVRGQGSDHGVIGTSGHIGVRGIHTGNVYGIGIHGSSGASGHAGYFNGAVYVTGTLSKAAGSFKIDHPLDPANKTLSHSFVESPDMMNIYIGNAITDAQGDATITMPAYFQSLNRDFRYQLTVIGQFAQAIVSREIEDNRFAIKTDKPHVKVSWLVTGVRQDAFANAHRISLEEDKPANERGRYLHPELWGQPEDARVHPRPLGLVVEAVQPPEPPRLEEPPRIDRARLEEEWRQVKEMVQRMR